MPAAWIELASGEPGAQRVDFGPGGRLDAPIGGEQAARLTLDPDRPDEALLDQHRIAVQGGDDLLQPVGEPCPTGNPIQLAGEGGGGDPGVPETLEGHG